MKIIYLSLPIVYARLHIGYVSSQLRNQFLEFLNRFSSSI